MNIDSELARMFGPCSFLLLQSVEDELIQLNQQRPRKKNLLLSLLIQKSERIEPLNLKSAHPDDQLMALAEEFGHPVLTVDIELKRRLYEQGTHIIEVTKNQRLKKIEGI